MYINVVVGSILVRQFFLCVCLSSEATAKWRWALSISTKCRHVIAGGTSSIASTVPSKRGVDTERESDLQQWPGKTAVFF